MTHAADSAFLAEVGLEPDAGPRAKGQKPSARRWRQPWHLDELRLDVIALREALAAGVLPQPCACMGLMSDFGFPAPSASLVRVEIWLALLHEAPFACALAPAAIIYPLCFGKKSLFFLGKWAYSK